MNAQIESSTDQNKSLYRRFIQEIFNEGRLDWLDEFVSPEFVLRGGASETPSGPAGARSAVTTFRSAFPNLKITVEQLVGEGDHVCARSTLRGTQQGPIFGIPPTGKSVTVTGLAMRFANGQLIESFVRNDVVGLMKQLKS